MKVKWWISFLTGLIRCTDRTRLAKSCGFSFCACYEGLCDTHRLECIIHGKPFSLVSKTHSIASRLGHQEGSIRKRIERRGLSSAEEIGS